MSDVFKSYSSKDIQNTLWRLADSLARNLRAPSDMGPGDPRWSVSGVANSAWEIHHPDFDLLKGSNSPLVMRIKRLSGNKWGVIAQNKASTSGTNIVISTPGNPPDDSWDVDRIAQTAAAWFQKQKDEISANTEENTPTQEPGALGEIKQDAGGGAGGPPPGPMGSRRTNLLARRALLLKGQQGNTSRISRIAQELLG
jgi:hypothetical protein